MYALNYVIGSGFVFFYHGEQKHVLFQTCDPKSQSIYFHCMTGNGFSRRREMEEAKRRLIRPIDNN